MTDSDIKLKVFRTIDQLTSEKLQQVYQLLMHTVQHSIGEEKSLEASYEGGYLLELSENEYIELEAAYEEMTADEANANEI